MIGFGKAAASCAFCTRDLPAAELVELDAPFLGQGPARVCGPCRDDFAGEVPDLAAFDPGFRGAKETRWVGPTAGDGRFVLRELVPAVAPAAGAAGALVARTLDDDTAQTLPDWRELVEAEPSPLHLAGGMAAAMAAGTELLPLDRLQRLVARARGGAAQPLLELLAGIHAHAAAGAPLPARDPPDLARTQLRLLEEAKNAYLMHGMDLATELDVRVGVLQVALRLAEGRGADAKAAVERIRRQADVVPSLHDPRIPMLHALVHLSQGSAGGADRALATALSWLEARPDRAAWRQVEGALLHDLAVRASESQRWRDAKDWLRRYCRLEPDDRRALLDLGHTYIKCSERTVAREVLESALDRDARADLERLRAADPEDEDGVLLYATCLARLGEVRGAFGVLEEDLGRARNAEPLRAERCHLAALCAFELGKQGEALELMVEAFERKPSRRTAEDLVRLLRPRVDGLVETMTVEELAALAGVVREHAVAIRTRFGVPHLVALLWFVGRELGQDFKGLSGFGLEDPAIRARFPADQITTLQAYVLLAQRKLADAVRKDREARAGGGAPVPFGMVLRFLARVRSWSVADRGVVGELVARAMRELG